MNTNTIRILAARLPEARKALTRLVNKARRYGCGDISFTEDATVVERERIVEWDGTARTVTVEYAELTITGDTLRIGEHEFMARVEIHSGGNLVDTVPGITDLNPEFRHTVGYCEHCHTQRNRKDVFIVRNSEGRQLQVGRDCLHDFLGVDPVAVAHRFKFWAAMEGFAGDYVGGPSDWGQSLEGVMALAAVCVRLYGWCSKGQAQYDESLMPTSGWVGMVLNPCGDEQRAAARKIVEARTDADYATAAATIKWVREELAANSDYTHNLKVIFGDDTIRDPRRLGLAVSAIAAYHRAQEQALRLTKEHEVAAQSQHIGAVGERIRDLPVTLQFQRVIGGNEWADAVLIKFVDDSGNILTWITSKGSGLEVGERALLTGTVKAHGDYNGAHETKMTRCKLAQA